MTEPTRRERVIFLGATRERNSLSGNPIWLLHTPVGDFWTEPDTALGSGVANHLEGSADFYVNREVVLTLNSRSSRVVGMELVE